MSKHNRERRQKYWCPCGNRFETALVEEGERAFAKAKSQGAKLPDRLPHSCGTCRRISCLQDGRFRYLTPAEELRYRMDFPQGAEFQDFAMAANLPCSIGLTPIRKDDK